MNDSQSSSQNVMANTGSYLPYSPIFGNVEVQAQPQQSFGAVQPFFGQVGYLSVEQVAISLQMSAPQQSNTVINSTQNSSTTIRGTTSYQDANGNVSMIMGYSANGEFN